MVVDSPIVSAAEDEVVAIALSNRHKHLVGRVVVAEVKNLQIERL